MSLASPPKTLKNNLSRAEHFITWARKLWFIAETPINSVYLLGILHVVDPQPQVVQQIAASSFCGDTLPQTESTQYPHFNRLTEAHLGSLAVLPLSNVWAPWDCESG
jgi:hypothetical protein